MEIASLRKTPGAFKEHARLNSTTRRPLRPLLHSHIIYSKRRRQCNVVGPTELDAHCLSGERAQVVITPQHVHARSSAVRVAESSQRSQQRTRSVSHFDVETVVDSPRRLAGGDVQPEVEVTSTRGNRDRLIKRPGTAVDAIDDHVSDTAVWVCASASCDLARDDPWRSARFKPGIDYQVSAATARRLLRDRKSLACDGQRSVA